MTTEAEQTKATENDLSAEGEVKAEATAEDTSPESEPTTTVEDKEEDEKVTEEEKEVENEAESPVDDPVESNGSDGQAVEESNDKDTEEDTEEKSDTDENSGENTEEKSSENDADGEDTIKETDDKDTAEETTAEKAVDDDDKEEETEATADESEGKNGEDANGESIETPTTEEDAETDTKAAEEKEEAGAESPAAASEREEVTALEKDDAVDDTNDSTPTPEKAPLTPTKEKDVVPPPPTTSTPISSPNPTRVILPPSSATKSPPPSTQTKSNVEAELSDALAKVKSLTAERDTALRAQSDNETQVLLIDLQSNLQKQMEARAEAENKARQLESKLSDYEIKIKKYSDMEDELEKLNAAMVSLVTDKSKVESELDRMREAKEESERREMILSNRLNDAKKKEAAKSNAAGRFESENDALKSDLTQTKKELETVTAARDKLESSLEKLKKKCVERVKSAEQSLVDERHLNEERKKKMKVFIETKAEELRLAKSDNEQFHDEVTEARSTIRDQRSMLEQLRLDLETSQTKNRELKRDIERMRKSSEKLHKMGDTLENELVKSAAETEEHKNKRLTAKHELMTILRTLEAERNVSGKLRDSIKFTFTPKALSQQQLLTESLKEFEGELFKLSRRLGRQLPPSPIQDEEGEGNDGAGGNGSTSAAASSSNAGASPNTPGKKKHLRGRSELDSDRLLSNLESETQKVSQGIMALTSSVERLHYLLDDSHDRSCMNVLTHVLAGVKMGDPSSLPDGEEGSGGRQRVNQYDEHDERVSIAASFAGIGARSSSMDEAG